MVKKKKRKKKQKYFGHPEFYRILDEELKKIHSDKNHDYAEGKDPLSNFKYSSQMAHIPAWQVAFSRICEKIGRISCYIEKGEYKVDESFDEVCNDIAILSVLMRIMHANMQGQILQRADRDSVLTSRPGLKLF